MSLVLQALAELAKRLLPGSEMFLVVGATVGLVLLWTGGSRRRAFGRAWLTALVSLYWVLSLPAVAGGLERALGGGYQPLRSADQAGGAQVVVVLTGGGVTLHGSGAAVDIPSRATAYRMLEAERLYRLLDQPLLLISGGPAGGIPEGNPESRAMREALVARGIPEERIRVEEVSGDTHEQSVRIAAWASQEGIGTLVLVTSGSHMRRALGAFRAEGLRPIPSAADEGAAMGGGLDLVIPSAESLSRSELAMREILALVYYAVRGWLA